jgi:hypothetical protein
MSLSEEDVAQFCLGLPGAREDYKWGGVRVFSIAANKMFALQGLRSDSLAFKVDKDLFLGHCDRPGIHPAPIWPGHSGSSWTCPTRWAMTNCVVCCDVPINWW